MSLFKSVGKIVKSKVMDLTEVQAGWATVVLLFVILVLAAV
jgi:hypothetical protein